MGMFNIIADMLAILVELVKATGQISGVIRHLVVDGLSILQYVNDTILFEDKATNLKLLLCFAFEDLSSLKISVRVNFSVSKRPQTRVQVREDLN